MLSTDQLCPFSWSNNSPALLDFFCRGFPELIAIRDDVIASLVLYRVHTLRPSLRSRAVYAHVRITMLSTTSACAPVAARAACGTTGKSTTRAAMGSQSMGSKGVGARGAVWRVSRGTSVPAFAGRTSVPVSASASRGASKRRSRRDRPPVLRASCDENTESGANAGDDANPDAQPEQYKTGLSADPAFDAALKSVSDMAGDGDTNTPAKPTGSPTKDDFVAPTIDWGDTKVRNLDGQEAVTYSAADFSAGEKVTSEPIATPSLAEEAMAQSAADGFVPANAAPEPVMAPLKDPVMATQTRQNTGLATLAPPPEQQAEQVRSFLYPGEEQLPDDVNMTVWEHLEELRDRALISAGACTAMILLCFCFAKDLVIFLEAPVAEEGVRFLQLGPGEYFFTTVKVAGYCGLLLGAPVVLYEGIAYVLPGLTKDERKFLGPIVLGSSVLFYAGIYFAYSVLTPAALKFFIGYANDAVESLWSIDQYFEFVLVLLFSTGLSFQVPVIQLLLGQTGLVSSKQMLSVWRYVVVGSVVAAAVLTPSTDPFTQMLLAVPLMSLYLGGAAAVGLVEKGKGELPGGGEGY